MKLGLTDIFVAPGVKINCVYYRDMLVSQQLLPVMRDVSGDFFVFRQRSAPVHRARDTAIFEQSTPAFTPLDLWLPNSLDLNPVDYKIWGDIRQRVYTMSQKTVQICFCQNFVKFPLILINFGKKMAKRLQLWEMDSFSISCNLCNHTTMLNADVLNC